MYGHRGQNKAHRHVLCKIDNILQITAKQLDERPSSRRQNGQAVPEADEISWIGAEKLKPEESIESVINHGTLGIGFIGLAECLVALYWSPPW